MVGRQIVTKNERTTTWSERATNLMKQRAARAALHPLFNLAFFFFLKDAASNFFALLIQGVKNELPKTMTDLIVRIRSPAKLPRRQASALLQESSRL